MLFIASFLSVLLGTAVIGIASKRGVRRAKDFANAGGRLNSTMVTGALVGGFVGGTSIIGTGELAFRHGLSALWFTLGGGLSVMLLGLFAGRFRALAVDTLPAMLGQDFGERVRLGASIFLCAGMFIQVIAQMLAAIPILSVLFQADTFILALIPMFLIMAYIFWGGFMGASAVGTFKTVSLLVLLCGAGGWLAGILPGDTYMHWYDAGRLSLFESDHSSGWAQGGAMFIGIFSTQAYLQPIFASRNTRVAKSGSIFAGILIILIGLCSAWIGLFMHDQHPYLLPKEAVPQFFMLYTTEWVAGGAIAVIFLSVIMTGAALALSIGTILNQDVIQRYTSRFASDAASINLSRLLIFGCVFVAYLSICLESNSYILQWAFLSMTIRGVTIFFPVLAVLLGYARLRSQWVEWAVWGAPLSVVLWLLTGSSLDPFYIGSAWSLLFLVLGYKQKSQRALR